MSLLKATISTVLLSLSLWGCGTPQNTPLADTKQPPVSEIASRSAVKQPLSEKEANEIMAGFVKAINQENPNYLLPFLLERDKFEAFAQSAISDYKTYFKGKNISKFELKKNDDSELDKDQGSIRRFRYKIYNPDGISKEIEIYQDNNVRIIDNFLSYSYWAKNLLDKFITAIQSNKPEALASALSPDDLEYPVIRSKEIITQYQANFDLNTLEYRLAGVDEKRNQFIYILYGSKNGKPVEHPVHVIYGDGLVGLKDTWIPDINSSLLH